MNLYSRKPKITTGYDVMYAIERSDFLLLDASKYGNFIISSQKPVNLLSFPRSNELSRFQQRRLLGVDVTFA